MQLCSFADKKADRGWRGCGYDAVYTFFAVIIIQTISQHMTLTLFF